MGDDGAVLSAACPNTITLHPHPTTPAPGLRLEVEVRRSGQRLSLEYRLGGAVAHVRWPDPQPARRTDDLWRNTCFEAFIGTGAGGYQEFNLSPTGAWAAYGFESYRQGMRPLDMAAPVIVARHSPDVFALTTDLILGDGIMGAGHRLAHRLGHRLGLSAVICGLDGSISYWAAAHPSDKPDFHHPDYLALDLPASEPE